MNIKTQQRVDVDLSLDSEEAKKLADHLKATLDENSDNTLLSISNHLSNAVDGKPKKERDPNAPRPGRKPKAKAEPGSETPAAPEAPVAPVAAKQPAQPTNPAPKQKVSVG